MDWNREQRLQRNTTVGRSDGYRPANETADWTFVPNGFATSLLAPIAWALGIVLAAALIAVLAVVVVLARRPKHT